MKKLLVVLCLGLTSLILSCGDDTSESESSSSEIEASSAQNDQGPNSYVPEGGATRFEGKGFTDQQIADLLEIETLMTDVLIRWSYRDKGGVYDNEFEYMQDRFTFDEYLKQTVIERANGQDSVVGFYVTGGEFFERDSVYIDDVVVFIGVNGNQIDFTTKDRLYYHRDRWIHPYISSIDEQLEYENVIRVADSAAAVEEQEGY